MKIGIDARSLEGKRTGVGRYLINLLLEWQNTKSKNLRFFLYFKEEIPKDLLELPRGLFTIRLLRTPFNINSNALFLHRALPKQAKKDKLDVLFCPDYTAPLFTDCRIALTLHDIIYEVHPEMYNWPSKADKILLKKVSKLSAKAAKVIFAPSEFTKQEVVEHYHTNPEKIKVTPLAVDDCFKRIHDPKKTEQIKRRYGIENKFILYVGSIFNRRHLDKAIEAFRGVAEDMPEYQFLIAGNNHTSPYVDIESLVEVANHRLGRKAILRKNHLEDGDLALLYNAADLLIWLSDYEGFGLPVAEAMACGTPVVTSSKASLPEVAGDGAIYVKDNQDTSKISKAVYKGLTNTSLREKLIKRGVERVERFSWKKCAQETLKALKQIK